MRRKLNLALDQRRKFELEIDNYKFTMENMRTKFENDLREKYRSENDIIFQGIEN